MSSEEGCLRIEQRGQTISCHVIGQATMRQSPALRRRVEQCLASGPVTLHVDLHECTYMDSTFIGTLLMFRRRLGDFALVGPSPDCCRLLQQMGLGAVFCVLAEESFSEEAGELLESESVGGSFKRTIVEAHQELAGLSGAAGAIFRAVADQLTKDWQAEERTPVAKECL
jgi:anti-sigma B factor antagonist